MFQCWGGQTLGRTVELLELIASPAWIYDSLSERNVCGNRAALELFRCDNVAFTASQTPSEPSCSTEQTASWRKLNARLHSEVAVDGKNVDVTVTSEVHYPGFVTLPNEVVVMAIFKPFAMDTDADARQVVLAQVIRQHTACQGDCDAPCDPAGFSRLVEMCNNHPMFQFLFDEHGKLLAGNKRALQNMREHLGDDQNDYTLLNYLALGEFSVAADEQEARDAPELYTAAMNAIFQQAKPCHRFPQLRESKRNPGKYRWVLYEMWPQIDPVTQQPAVLICEQNITQVKALEEQFRRRNSRLQAQLEEALSNRDHDHNSAIDIDTPADKTLKLLDKIMRGQEVEAWEANQLRDSIIRSGDLRQPVNFNEQVMGQTHSTLDLEVGESLIQLLSSRKSSKHTDNRPVTTDGTCPSSSSFNGSDAPPSLHHHHHHPPFLSHPGSILARLSNGPGTPSPASDAPPSLPPSLGDATAAAAAAQDVRLSQGMPDAVMGVLSRVDEWQFDAFELAAASGGRPLSMLSYYLFKRFELISKFELDEDRLIRFLMRVEDGYPNNPYHNRIHAADVLQSLHVLLYRGNLIQCGMVDDTALLACHLSAIIHDYDHRGVNNDYLIRMSDPLAILYNDRSPMENHHLAASWQLLNSDEFNFMPATCPRTREALRKLVIEMVLATDMKQHFAVHSMFQSKMQLAASPSASAASRSGNNSSSQLKAEAASQKLLDDDMKTLSIQLALKCCDLGHLSSPRVVHKKWVHYLEEEFFRQGDKEKQNQIQVSPLMDRSKNGITMSQVGFFDIVALPLFQSFSQVFTETTPLLDAVKDNYAMWREDAARSALSKQHSGSSR